jgi:hypothetical protein
MISALKEVFPALFKKTSILCVINGIKKNTIPSDKLSLAATGGAVTQKTSNATRKG